ncbi:MAG: RluA family pseudouridine synthase [Thermodesulfobacteriota bacterium]
MKIDINIHNDLTGTRLDTIISDFVETCSRTRAGYLINSSHILVNNNKKKPGYRVKQGDIISGIIDEANSKTEITPEKIDLNIIFEDDHIIVINKNPGMVVHPAPGNLSKTLVNALLFHEPAIKNVGKDLFRSGIVHRLDKDTSGLMVVAKTRQALHFLQKEFKQRRIEKRYLALIAGNLSEDNGQIELPIGRHTVKRKIMAVNYETGKAAITDWKVKTRYTTACLIEALLKTGRTHQIRVHFYAIDHPLIGERIYQHRRFRKKKSAAPRQMLHSWKLAFRHPYSGRKISFRAELPEDFIQTISMFNALSG